MRAVRRLREEEAQSLVLVISVMFFAMLLVGLVVTIGSWLEVQRKVQSVADAAALAGVQELHGGCASCGNGAAAAASQYASKNSPSGLVKLDTVDVPQSDNYSTIEVKASAPLSALSPVLSLTGLKRATAAASAEVQPPQTLSNSELGGPPEPYITPLVISQRIMQDCLQSNCFDTSEPALSIGDGLGVFCATSCPVTGRGRGSGRRSAAAKIAGWITGGVPGTYPRSVDGAPDGAVASNRVADALRNVEGRTLILPVFSNFDGRSYDLSGFAAFVIDPGGVSWDNGTCNGGGCRLYGHFTTYTTSGTLSPSGGTTDYGVRVLGLTG